MKFKSSVPKTQEVCFSLLSKSDKGIYISGRRDILASLSLKKVRQLLKEFTDTVFEGKVDETHPDILEIFYSLIEGNFSEEKIISSISKVTSFSSFKTRLIKNKSLREEIRSLKNVQNIDLYSFCKNLQSNWESSPDSFDKFMRFDESYKNDIKLANKKAKRYEEIGCMFLADEVKNSIGLIEETNKLYYGFHPISILSTSTILAKIMGFHISENLIVGHIAPYGEVLYEPRVYPLRAFFDIASKRTKKALKILEKFPQANEKPIFDNFCVVVPSIQIIQQSDENYCFLDCENIFQTYKSKHEALNAFDRSLIRNKLIHAVLLGEKDEKCYFLNFFD
jgi:hypothetical protein